VSDLYDDAVEDRDGDFGPGGFLDEQIETAGTTVVVVDNDDDEAEEEAEWASRVPKDPE
jgi:hypothetical protein